MGEYDGSLNDKKGVAAGRRRKTDNDGIQKADKPSDLSPALIAATLMDSFRDGLNPFEINRGLNDIIRESRRTGRGMGRVVAL